MNSELIRFTPWREVLIEKAGYYYSHEDETHGIHHAKKVEQLTREISLEPEYSHLHIDYEVLNSAALLHDTGYSQERRGWREDKREHVVASMKIAENLLGHIPTFSDNPEKITQVSWLIFNHDNSNYLFPIKGRRGEPAITRDLVRESEDSAIDANLLGALAILKEADSRSHTGTEGAKRVLHYNLNQKIPLFARGDPLRAWMWGESAVGSVRLAAKRALLDARTQRGKEIAKNGYLEVEDFIKRECKRNGVEYLPELDLSELDQINEKRLEDKLEIVKVHPWEELVGKLRQVHLTGDSTLFPYVSSRIESHSLKVDGVYPLSFYALSGQIELTRKLRELFLATYALDLLDLSGTIQFRLNGEDHIISPPLVEISRSDNNVRSLVDGIHRFLLAKDIGARGVRSVVISEVPDHFPLLPLPLEWEEVKACDAVPEKSQKRRFRFPDLTSFPDISKFSDVEVTEENYLYFFYRDFSDFGSSGIRKKGEIK